MNTRINLPQLARTLGLCVLLALTLASRTSHAQALPTGFGPGTYIKVGGAYSGFKSDYGSQTITGASVYIDSNLYWQSGIETEARRIVYPSFGERQSTLLVGPRWSFRPRRFNPYIKVLAGGGRFDFPYGYGHGNYFVAAPGAGVDMQITRRISARLIDFEYQEWPGFTFGAIKPYGISAGISFQIYGSMHTKMSR